MSSILRQGALLLAALAVPSFASPLLEDRGTCNRDNLLRCLDPTASSPSAISTRAAATAFCSSVLSIPVVTSTITTITPITSVTSTVTTIDGTVVKVSTATSTTTEVDESTVTTTSFLAARSVATIAAPPQCVTNGASYAPSRLSSACSCLSVTPSTTYVTATASPSTSVIISVIDQTTTTTTQTTVPATTTTTNTVTVTTIAPAPTCEAGTTPITADGQLYCGTPGYYIIASNSFTDMGYPVDTVTDFSSCLNACASSATRCVGANFIAPSLCELVYHSTSRRGGTTWNSAFLAGTQ